MKISIVSLFKFFFVFSAIFCLNFILGVNTARADGSITQTIGGTVYSDYIGGTPVPNATVILHLGAYVHPSWNYEYLVFVTDSNGHYETTKTFPCYGERPDDTFSALIIPYALLDDGTLQVGNSLEGGIRCVGQPEWANGYSILVPGSAKNERQNAGDTCPKQSVGMPVNVTNGNMWLKQNDYALPGTGDSIEVTRTYNSMIQTSGIFGFGWTSDFDESLYDYYIKRLTLPNGQYIFFIDTGSNNYISITRGFYAQISKNQTDGTYLLTFKDGRIHKFNADGKLLWRKDRNGNQTTLNYDTNGNLAGITDAFNRTLNITPNLNGTVASISDSIGTTATYEYYPNTNLLKTVTYADGSKYKFEYDTTTSSGKTFLKTVKDALDNVLETHNYDSQGRATTSEKTGGIEKYTLDFSHLNDNISYTTVTDALGRTTKYTYDKTKGRNVVTKIEGNCNCGGNGSQITNYEYDAKLNLTKKTDALGRQTVYTYDLDGNQLSMTDLLGTETYTYNSFGEVLTRTDRMNGATTNTYDATGNLLTTSDALNNTTTLTYTTLGQIATVKDALNHTTTLTYDAQGRLTQVKDANNKNTNYTYDARAKLTSATNALNQTTTYQYDLNNRLKKTIYPDTNFEENTYDLAGRRTQAKDARGNTTTFGYDAAYRLTSVTDALSHATTFGYDLMSNRMSQTDALNQTTNYEYDEFNRLKKVKYPAATTGGTRLEESLTYDAVGNVKTRVDTAGRTTSYDYDNVNRLQKITDALLQSTQFEYNARSQMTKVTDALNQVYQFTYDPLGRQLSQTRAGTTMAYEYDAVGNRTKRTDYTGRQTTYNYDVLNRLTQINYLQSYNGNAPLTPIKAASYAYDDLSRLISATNDAGTVSFTYDTRGRLKTTTDVFNHLVEYGYDANGNRTQLKLDNAVHATYAYDLANRLTTLTDEANQNFTFGYDIANRLISKTLPNTITTTYNYDGMSRLTRLKNQSSSATLTDNNFAYNAANQISQIAELAQTKNFTYDNIDRLTNMTNGTANETYAFDAVGNRTSSSRSASYSYQPNNKLVSTASANYTYDANGNLLSKKDASGFWIYGWDYENRMVSARKQNKIVRYQYDALGRRVSRFGKSVGATARYTYDGLDVLMDDGSEGVVKYQNGLGIDNKLKMVSNGNAKYFLQDHLGSTIGLTDSSGNVVSSASYDSFGNSTNNLTTRYQYTGREFDSFTGLYFYRARWYDANLGRFISEDPIGFDGDDINLYGYVWSNPINFTDPTGLDGWGNDTADWLDDRIDYARRWYQGDDQDWIQNGLVNTGADMAFGSADMLRVGNGTAQAFCDCDENIYGRAAFFLMDVQRASGLFAILGGAATRISSSCSKGLGTNPFKGKTPQEIEDMFLKKGFQPKGPNPLGGDGTYVNPKNGRGYHIDAGHPPPKGPHVGAHRPRNMRKTKKPRDYGL